MEGDAVLSGERIVLRPQRRSDVEARHSELAGDYAVHALAFDAPWRPQSLEAALAEFDKHEGEVADQKAARFTVGRREDPMLEWVGDALLWGLDEHQSTAHLGVMLGPAARGQGLGTDVIRVLCDYAFRVRNIYRLGLEAVATNEPMLRAAQAAGFTEEGRLREGAYVLGDRVDEVVFGLLRREWN